MPLLDYPVELAAMAALVAASAFFSGSEAALFSLTRVDRTAMASGAPADRRAAALLRRPERLLTAILFWNLVVNLTYFALTEVLAVRLSRVEGVPPWAPTVFTVGSVLTVILLSEVLPKSLAVLEPRWLSGLVSTPLAGAMRLVDPLLPSLQATSNAAARMLLPKLEQEPYMELADLERAVQFRSGETIDSETLLIQERQVLHRLVELADTTAAELMVPRTRCLVLPPPVSLADVVGRAGGVGDYVLVTEPDSDEIAGAVPVTQLAMLPTQRLDLHAQPLSVVPWCASAAATLSRLREEGRRVAVVVNELGETIGIVPLERLLDAVLRDAASVDPHDAHAAWLAPVGDSAWEASGGTPLRHVGKRIGPWVGADDRVALTANDVVDALGAARSRTVGGLLQEHLERPPKLGDQIEAAGLVWSVTAGSADADGDDPIAVRIELVPDEPETKPAEGGDA